MFKRVMVAVVGLPLLILILGWAPSWATMLLLAGHVRHRAPGS